MLYFDYYSLYPHQNIRLECTLDNDEIFPVDMIVLVTFYAGVACVSWFFHLFKNLIKIIIPISS